MTTQSLTGLSVLVTRPQDQQAGFIKLLEAEGASALSLPCIQIQPADNPATVRQQLIATSTADAVIFTSVNAVKQAHALLPMPWYPPIPSKTSPGGQPAILATGPATASLLSAMNMPVAESPLAPFNSEALLDLPLLQQKSLQEIAIVKGHGGRELLAQSLSKRGIMIDFINVYSRTCPEFPENTLGGLLLNSTPDIVTITSNEALKNLVTIAGNTYQTLLLKLPLIVNSERCASLANKLGFQSQVMIAPLPGDHGQLAAVKQWNRSYRPKL